MPRYAAFLRGVSPMNLKMPDLKKCLEDAGFTNVVTVISSGNVVFDSRSLSEKNLERKIETSLENDLGKKFFTIVRSIEDLKEMVDSKPFQPYKLPSKAKPLISFLQTEVELGMNLPYSKDGISVLEQKDGFLLWAYLPSAKPANFMSLIERKSQKKTTSRTLETVKKVILK